MRIDGVSKPLGLRDRLLCGMYWLSNPLYLPTVIGLVWGLIFLLGGCAPTTLDLMQRDIQNCILSGGHARLGPAGSVACLNV